MDFRVFSQNLPEKMQARCVRKDAEQALKAQATVKVKRLIQNESTAEMLDAILEKGELSDAQLRTLVRRIVVHRNEDKSLDIRLEFNGDF